MVWCPPLVPVATSNSRWTSEASAGAAGPLSPTSWNQLIPLKFKNSSQLLLKMFLVSESHPRMKGTKITLGLRLKHKSSSHESNVACCGGRYLMVRVPEKWGGIKKAIPVAFYKAFSMVQESPEEAGRGSLVDSVRQLCTYAGPPQTDF